MQTETVTDGIILKSTPFEETKVILHLFTKELGLVSAIASLKKSSYLSSMMLIEGTLKRGKGDMYTLREPHILNTFPELRKDFSLLQLSMKLINTLSKTLVKERPIPALFLLTKNTLAAMTPESNSKAIYFCYHLKLLLFEGLLPLNPEAIDETLTEKDKDDYLTLATAKKFGELNDVHIAPSLEEAIENYLQFNFA